MSEIAEIFNKAPLEWTPADVDQVVAFYKELVRDKRLNPTAFKKDGTRKKVRGRKAKTDPRQIDLEELIAKETAK